MGMACAMAWVMFIIIALLTVIAFGSQKHWVYYADWLKEELIYGYESTRQCGNLLQVFCSDFDGLYHGVPAAVDGGLHF